MVTDLLTPPPDAPAESWRLFINRLIAEGRFATRRLSWVCRHGECFLKIPRIGEQTTPSLDEPAAAAGAAREYTILKRLGEIDPGVAVPVRVVGSCVVKRRLAGPDLWELARRECGSPRVRAAIEQCLVMAARFHRLQPNTIKDAPVRDYAKDPWLPAPAEVCALLKRQPATLVIGGFSVDNFRWDSIDRTWKFLDPNHVSVGVAEDDFARYILSLLFVNWGRNAKCTPWEHFSLNRLKDAYHESRGHTLNSNLLEYMFQRRLAMQKDCTFRIVGEMRPLQKWFAQGYQWLYIHQMKSLERQQNWQ